MSNCHLVAGRSLIDLVASRLALRAPALRAATTLTRPTRSAHSLPCSRRAAPTGKMVGPSHVITYHCVECRDHLAHHGHDRDLWYLTCCFETMTEGLKRRIPVSCAHGGHVEHMTNRRTTTPNTALSFELSTVEVVGGDPDQRRDLLAAHPAEFRQQRDQGAGEHQPDSRHRGKHLVAARERGISCDNLGQAVIELGQYRWRVVRCDGEKDVAASRLPAAWLHSQQRSSG